MKCYCLDWVVIGVVVALAAGCGVATHNEGDEGEVVETISGFGDEDLLEACGPNEGLAAALIDWRVEEGPFQELEEVESVAIELYDAEIVDGAGDGLCLWYQWLVDHYASRALQSGMWGNAAMANWYSYWAELYQGLVDEVCLEVE